MDPSFSDPLTNLKAAAAYAMDRYGTVTVTGRILPTATARTPTGRVRAGEYVLTPEARKAMLGDWVPSEEEEELSFEYPEPPPPPVF